MVGMGYEARLVTSTMTGLAIAFLTWVNDGFDRNWLAYLLAFVAGVVISLTLLGIFEITAGYLFVRKDQRIEASLSTLLAKTNMDAEAFKSMSYHTAYVVLMHPGLTTEQLVAQASMKPHLDELGPVEAEALFSFAGAYFRTANRFGLASDGTWQLVERNRSARRSMQQHARALTSGKVPAVDARPVAA